MVLVVLAAVFTGCLVNLYVTHALLKSHQEAMAALIGRHARDLTHKLSQAEERISETARTGIRARGGPARLRDQPPDPNHGGSRDRVL